MVKVNEIRAHMARHNVSRTELAKCLGMTVKTLDVRFKTKIFWTDECEKMIDYLHITDTSIFFDGELRGKKQIVS